MSAGRIPFGTKTYLQLADQAAFMTRQEERDSVRDAKTAKNRAKRQKRKDGRKGGSAGDNAVPDRGELKRKLAGGGLLRPPVPGPGEEDSDEDAGPLTNGHGLDNGAPAESKVVIHDDD